MLDHRIPPVPSALLRARGLIDVRAAANAGATLDTVLTAFEEFKAKHEGRYDAIKAALDKRATLDQARKLNGEAGSEPSDDPEYRKTFASYVRKGASDAEAVLQAANTTGDRGAIRAAMSEGDNSAGGYLAPIEWDRQVRKAQRHLSPMRRLARIVTSGVNGYSTLWSNESWGSGWVGETASRPATATASLTPITFPTGEIYANPAATQRLIDDALINFEEWIGAELGDEFSRQEGIAFIGGTGVNMPMGLLQYLPGGLAAGPVLNPDGTVATPGAGAGHPGGNLGITPSGAAATLTPDGLVDLKYQLGTPYCQGATWLMNSATAAVIAKMKNGDGMYIWREGLTLDQPATLLGSPVEIDENMPNVAAGATPIAFGDFSRGYLINDRIGVRILRDPYTAKPYVLFFATKRVGGGLLDPKAIRVQRVAAS